MEPATPRVCRGSFEAKSEAREGHGHASRPASGVDHYYSDDLNHTSGVEWRKTVERVRSHALAISIIGCPVASRTNSFTSTIFLLIALAMNRI